MQNVEKIRRGILVFLVVGGVIATVLSQPDMYTPVAPSNTSSTSPATGDVASAVQLLPVKGRAPKTNYARTQFGDGWQSVDGCDTRNIILHRDLTNLAVNEKCQVVSGTLQDPYTGKEIVFKRGETSSSEVQIDHVVALSNAWQTGAQQLTPEKRQELANDPLELLAVDGPANQQKSDGDAATWLPSNKAFRCQYVARQVAVKKKYSLWLTNAEKEAILHILSSCPEQLLPSK